jgi:hypothetical protein
MEQADTGGHLHPGAGASLQGVDPALGLLQPESAPPGHHMWGT